MAKKIDYDIVARNYEEIVASKVRAKYKDAESWFDSKVYPALPTAFKMIGIFAGSLLFTLMLLYWIGGMYLI